MYILIICGRLYLVPDSYSVCELFHVAPYAASTMSCCRRRDRRSGICDHLKIHDRPVPAGRRSSKMTGICMGWSGEKIHRSPSKKQEQGNHTAQCWHHRISFWRDTRSNKNESRECFSSLWTLRLQLEETRKSACNSHTPVAVLNGYRALDPTIIKPLAVIRSMSKRERKTLLLVFTYERRRVKMPIENILGNKFRAREMQSKFTSA